MHVYVSVCEHVCVRQRLGVCMSVCVCVCERERERGKEKESDWYIT